MILFLSSLARDVLLIYTIMVFLQLTMESQEI